LSLGNERIRKVTFAIGPPTVQLQWTHVGSVNSKASTSGGAERRGEVQELASGNGRKSQLASLALMNFLTSTLIECSDCHKSITPGAKATLCTAECLPKEHSLLGPHTKPAASQ